MNLEVVFKTITTIITIAVMYCLIGLYGEEQDYGFYEFGIYAALATLGSILAIIFGLSCNRLFAKSQFITSITSTVTVVFIAIQTGLFSNIPMGDLCIAITFIIVSSDVAESKNKEVEKPLKQENPGDQLI